MKIRNSVLATTVCLTVGVLGLAGCSDSERTNTGGGPPGAQAATGSSDTVAAACGDLSSKYPSLKGKKFTIGTTPGEHYYDYVEESNPSEVKGLEPDIMKAVAKCAGFTTEYQKLDFNGLVTGLEAKRIDLVTSGMYANPERAKVVNFVTYMKAAEAAVVRKGNPKGITGMDSLCGTTVAQVVGTVEVALAEKQSKTCVAAGKPAIKFINFTQSTQLTQALGQGRADVFLTDSGVAARLAKDFGDSVETAFPIVSDFKFGVAVRKTDPDLMKAIHEAITALHAKGELTKLATKWGFAAEQVIEPAIVTS